MTQQTILPSLMFIGQAVEAMSLYLNVFGGSILADERYGPEEQGREGTIKQAKIELRGMHLLLSDSPAVHDFTFTPSTSLFVNCDSEADLDELATALGEGGKVLMPSDNYGFSRKFTFLNDRFGVSWQLNWV